MYHWTLDYCLDHLTLRQVCYFANEAAIFNNPDLEDKPDKKAFHDAYGPGKKLSR